MEWRKFVSVCVCVHTKTYHDLVWLHWISDNHNPLDPRFGRKRTTEIPRPTDVGRSRDQSIMSSYNVTHTPAGKHVSVELKLADYKPSSQVVIGVAIINIELTSSLFLQQHEIHFQHNRRLGLLFGYT